MPRYAVTLFLAVAAFGQSDRGAIKGLIVDAQGLAAPNSTLRLTNTATGVRWPASSDSTGGFLFAALPVGTYEMTCELTGFKKFTFKALAEKFF